MDSKLLIVCGPTATGKTALALRLAKHFHGELVSADSRQVYRGMDIATGKDVIGKSQPKADQPLAEKVKNQTYELVPYDMDGIPLWMLDVVHPDEEFSVAHYQALASVVIADILKRGKLPIIVGGTGLYIQSLLSSIETSHIPPNKALRDQLERLNLDQLQDRLTHDDPLVWERLNQSDRQNPRRLIRKIEIAQFYHQPHATHTTHMTLSNYDALLIGLTAPNQVLYQRIDERVDTRVREGVVAEIQTLLKKGYSWDLPSMNTFGYKEWKDHFTRNSLLGTRSLEPIIQRWKFDEHGYARRQMVWFKKMPGIQWMDITQSGLEQKVETLVGEWYTK